MDLLQTVRKEGSRGGVNFSWDDVKGSQHRENYLGHSLMAPVGRWQKGKDLNWYARAGDAELTPEERAEAERERKREELRKVKEAEEDAMARALGLPVPDRTNANNEPLGEKKFSQTEVNKALKEALDDGDEDRGKGIGFGQYSAVSTNEERRELKALRRRDDHKEHRTRSQDRKRDYEGADRASRRHRRSRSRSRSKSPNRDRERRNRQRHKRHSRSRSPSRDRRKHRSRSREHRDEEQFRKRREYRDRSRSRDRDRDRERDRDRRRHRTRSRSNHEYKSRRRDQR